MNTPIVNALAGALFHFVWEGAALALLLAVSLAVFRGAGIRYGLACAALFAMPVSFAVTAALLYPHIIPLPNPVIWPAVAGAVVRPGPAAAEPLLNRLRDSVRWFVPVWFAGIAIFCLRSVGGWMGVRRLRGAGVSAAPAEWQARVAGLASRLSMKRAVTLLESRLVDVPLVAGFLRPVILIPAGLLAGMPAEQIEYLLIHELAHVRRFDYFVNLLQKAIEGMLFYHPAVWWVSGVIAREREYCCDDVVLSIFPEPRRYASTLAALEQSRWAALPAANGGSLPQRVRRILGRSRRRTHLAPAPAVAAVLLAVSAAAGFAALHRPALALFAQAQQTSGAVSDIYDRWLNEDVVYIIEDQERRAFRNLGTDEERDKFIEQFWERRDPTPGTPENEFKEEHYRRIGYVNSRFSSTTKSGWRTDRGRIYITFGPPDEIDSHPSCSASAPAVESWKYRYLDGIGNNVLIDFTDASCTGEYRMTMDPAAGGGVGRADKR
jgi:GWxTD domain-containing protein